MQMVPGTKDRSCKARLVSWNTYQVQFAVTAYLLCLRTCLHILAMTSLLEPRPMEAEDAFGSLDRSDDTSRAFLKYSFCFSEKRVSADVTAKTTSLTENTAGLGRSFARFLTFSKSQHRKAKNKNEVLVSLPCAGSILLAQAGLVDRQHYG